MSKNESQRAQLVSLLWSLKQALVEAGSGTSDVKFVHFNSLLHDEDYRQEILEKARRAQSEVVRGLVQQIDEIHLGGSLVGYERADQRIHGENASLASPTQSPSQPARPKRTTGLGAALWTVGIFLAIIGLSAMLGFFPFEPDRHNAAAEQADATHPTKSDALPGANGVIPVSGSITNQEHWKGGLTYVLQDMVYVESGATLTIEPGVRVLGKPGSALVVTRDGSIEARGTQSEPIVFTSAKPAGQRKRGDWGGVVLLGNAPVNTGQGHIEGIPKSDPRGAFGGGDRYNSCGILQYVRIEFAGFEISADNELNGLTLGGCGDGTLLRYVQVHMGLDDGIEFFGGSANLSHVVISRSGDDGLDWDRGWTGNAQFVVIQQDPSDGDNGIEADNYKKDNDAQPRSAPTLSNVTIVGSKNSNIAQRGMVLRRGTCGDLRNMLVFGFTKEALDIRDQSTVKNLETGCLSFKSVIFTDPAQGTPYFTQENADKDDDGGFDEAAYFASAESGVMLDVKDVVPKGAFNLANPSFVPPFNPLLTEKSAPLPQGEFWDEAANFIGAERPGNRTSWLGGWTDFPDD